VPAVSLLIVEHGGQTGSDVLPPASPQGGRSFFAPPISNLPEVEMRTQDTLPSK